jgi:hypothetical protein
VSQTVEVGGVDEIEALIDGGTDRRGGDVVVVARPGQAGHGAAAERDRGDRRSGSAEYAVQALDAHTNQNRTPDRAALGSTRPPNWCPITGCRLVTRRRVRVCPYHRRRRQTPSDGSRPSSCRCSETGVATPYAGDREIARNRSEARAEDEAGRDAPLMFDGWPKRVPVSRVRYLQRQF